MVIAQFSNIVCIFIALFNRNKIILLSKRHHINKEISYTMGDAQVYILMLQVANGYICKINYLFYMNYEQSSKADKAVGLEI